MKNKQTNIKQKVTEWHTHRIEIMLIKFFFYVFRKKRVEGVENRKEQTENMLMEKRKYSSSKDSYEDLFCISLFSIVTCNTCEICNI